MLRDKSSRALVEQLAARASIPPRRLQAPGPDSAEIDLIIRAAIATPSHGGLRSFRLVVIEERQRPTLSQLFRQAKLEECPGADEEDLQRAAGKAFHAPTLILLIARAFPDHPDIPLIEQHASAGAAMSAMLSAAHLLGYGAMAVSGDKMVADALRTAFGLALYEHALCFIAIGTPSAPARDKRRPSIEDVSTTWRP
jgi:nitroreductase